MSDNTALAVMVGAIAVFLLLLVTMLEIVETKEVLSCINAGMEWIDGDCVRGDGE